MSNPQVSVVIPTYNNASLVGRAIGSVLAQSYRNLEILVVNDGSTDHTLEILSQYSDDRIQIINQANQERSAARNTGIRNATGEYIAFLDDDDWWHPLKIEKQIRYLDENPSLVLVCTWAYSVTPDEKIISLWGRDFPTGNQGKDQLVWLFLSSSIPTPTVLLRRDLLDRIGLFNTDIRYGEDWDLWMRTAVFGEFGCVPEPLAYYRLRGRYLPGLFDRTNFQENRLAILEGIQRFVDDLNCGARLPLEIRRRGVARAMWEAALTDYAVDRIDVAQKRAINALSHDQIFFNSYKVGTAGEMLVGFAVGLNDIYTPPDVARDYLEKVLDNLPDELEDTFRPAELYGALWMWYGHYHYHHNNNHHDALKYMMRALWTYPHLLSDRGLLSVFTRSLLKS